MQEGMGMNRGDKMDRGRKEGREEGSWVCGYPSITIEMMI